MTPTDQGNVRESNSNKYLTASLQASLSRPNQTRFTAFYVSGSIFATIRSGGSLLTQRYPWQKYPRGEHLRRASKANIHNQHPQ